MRGLKRCGRCLFLGQLRNDLGQYRRTLHCEKRAEYGKELLERLSNDLTVRYGRGFARPDLIRFRQFYSAFPDTTMYQLEKAGVRMAVLLNRALGT
jgi:hypothetical protein